MASVRSATSYSAKNACSLYSAFDEVKESSLTHPMPVYETSAAEEGERAHVRNQKLADFRSVESKTILYCYLKF